MLKLRKKINVIIVMAITIVVLVMASVSLHASVYTIKPLNYTSYTVLDPSQVWNRNNDNSDDVSQQLVSMVSIRYRLLKSAEASLTSDVDLEPTDVFLMSRPLVYPNPFRLTDNVVKDAEIGYELSSSGDIEIRIYDFRAFEVYKKQFNAGTLGGTVGYNRIPLSKSEFDYVDMPSGIYVYLIIHNQEIIGKGRCVIKP